MVAQIKFIILILVSLFFISFGILLMVSAYSLNNPFEFIITFFAASFIILISATLCLVFLLQLIRTIKSARPKNNNGSELE